MTAPTPLGGPRVLVVDDDESLRHLLIASLRDRGCLVRGVGTIAEARVSLAEGLPQVLVVDGLLPDGTGAELLAELPDGRDRPKVIYISAELFDAATVHELRQSLGTSVVLPKPIDTVELSLHVLGLVGAHTQANATPPPAQSQLDRLNGLCLAYQERLVEQLDVLAIGVRATADGSADQGPTLHLAHKLHGTAGSFGFGEVSRMAGEVEATLLSTRSSDGPSLRLVRLAEHIEAHRLQLLEQPAQARIVPPADVDEDQDAVLLVLDDPPLSLELAATGQDQGLAVICARTEAEAISLALDRPPQLVVVSSQLGPGDDAFRLIRRLRALPSGSSLRVALVTGDDETTVRLMAARSPVELLHSGPLTPALFVELTRHLEQRRPRPPRILVIDDDIDFCQRISLALEGCDAEVVQVNDPTECMGALDQHEPDLVLLDLIMPVLSGLDLCRLIRASARWCELPVVVTTAWTEPEVRTLAYRSGADDYLPKPLVDEELSARVVRRAQRARQEREARERDGLTDLLLRAPFLDRTQQLLAAGRRAGTPVSIAMIDLDAFKAVNDLHGHLVGDRVLAVVGGVLAQAVRAEDLCARWGGEEFALALVGATEEEALMVLDRALRAVSKVSFTGAEGTTFHVTFSGGVACTDTVWGDLTALLRCADANLYRAKDAGRARIVA